MHPSKFKERRQFLRYQVNLPVDLHLENSIALKVHASNLSLGGLMFSCDDWISKKIESRGIQHHSLDHTQISISMELDNTKMLYANCRIVTARRVSQDNYLVGLEFTEFQKKSEDSLQAYINSL